MRILLLLFAVVSMFGCVKHTPGSFTQEDIDNAKKEGAIAVAKAVEDSRLHAFQVEVLDQYKTIFERLNMLEKEMKRVFRRNEICTYNANTRIKELLKNSNIQDPVSYEPKHHQE